METPTRNFIVLNLWNSVFFPSQIVLLFLLINIYGSFICFVFFRFVPFRFVVYNSILFNLISFTSFYYALLFFAALPFASLPIPKHFLPSFSPIRCQTIKLPLLLHRNSCICFCVCLVFLLSITQNL